MEDYKALEVRIGGEHATCVNGNGRNPDIKDILSVAEKIGIAKTKSKEIAEQVRQTVLDELGDIIYATKPLDIRTAL